MADEEIIPVIRSFWGIQIRITDEKGTITDADCWPLAADRGQIEDTIDEDGLGVLVYLGDEMENSAYLFTLKSEDDESGETVLFLGYPNVGCARMVAAGQYDPDEVEEIRELSRIDLSDILRDAYPQDTSVEPTDLPELVPAEAVED